jgi:hypothetical protein
LRTRRSGFSKSNAVTLLIVGIFVGIVIAALVLTYAPSGRTSTTTNDPISVSGLTLISGTGSSASLNKTCAGDTYLQIYVTNNSPNIYYLTNVTMIEYHTSKNSTALTPLSNGCLPVSESNPEVPQGANDVLIQTYPVASVPPYTGWNVTIIFSNGQSVFQPDLLSSPSAGG